MKRICKQAGCDGNRPCQRCVKRQKHATCKSPTPSKSCAKTTPAAAFTAASSTTVTTSSTSTNSAAAAGGGGGGASGLEGGAGTTTTADAPPAVPRESLGASSCRSEYSSSKTLEGGGEDSSCKTLEGKTLEGGGDSTRNMTASSRTQPQSSVSLASCAATATPATTSAFASGGNMGEISVCARV